MNLNLNGKRALVTGASQGIGRQIARQLLDEGCHVRLVARDATALERARYDLALSGYGDRVAVHRADLGDRADLATLYPLLAEVDLLVNSAGAVQRGRLLETDADGMRASFDVKVMGTIDLCREAYRCMSTRRPGSVILNIIGASGERPNPKSVATSTANAALIAFTRAVGAASPDDGIRVVGINPGLTDTPRTRGTSEGVATAHDQAYAQLIDRLPFGRMASTAEIADMALFLLSERAGYISGSVVSVDGGAPLRL